MTILTHFLDPSLLLLALGFAYYFFRQMMKKVKEPIPMANVAYVRQGAMSYSSIKVVTIVFIVLALLFGLMKHFGLQNQWLPLLLTGGFFSGLAGFSV